MHTILMVPWSTKKQFIRMVDPILRPKCMLDLVGDLPPPPYLILVLDNYADNGCKSSKTATTAKGKLPTLSLKRLARLFLLYFSLYKSLSLPEPRSVILKALLIRMLLLQLKGVPPSSNIKRQETLFCSFFAFLAESPSSSFSPASTTFYNIS